MNETILGFGYPLTLVRDYAHWLVLLRPTQPTLGSLIVAAKSDATDFAALPGEAFAELATVTDDVERALKAAVDYARINWLMLMMVDPHVHFHVLPRYEGSRTHAALEIADAGWPKLPDLASAVTLDDTQRGEMVRWLRGYFPS